MTLDQINHAPKSATRSYVVEGLTYDDVYFTDFAYAIAAIVRAEMLSVARANLVLSNDAKELYKDLQAYDRHELGLNF